MKKAIGIYHSASH